MDKVFINNMIKQNSIAILLAAYNGTIYIQEQIESILRQKDVNLKIFISIDFSTDGTRDFLEATYGNHPQITILDDIGRFGGAARNFFRLIRDVDFRLFDFIAFSDQDDVWYSEKLVHAVKVLNETHADGYSSNVMAFWENGREKLIIKSQPQCAYDYLFEAAGPGCTYVMTQKLAQEFKSFVVCNWAQVNQLWLHDWVCYAYARANGFDWVIDEKPNMRYRQHINNQVGANQGLKAFIYRCRKILYGGAIVQAKEISILIGMKDHPFVRIWSALDRSCFLKLALHFKDCRRKSYEKYLFFFICILISIFGGKK